MMLTLNTTIAKNEKFSTATIGCFLRLPLTSHNLAYASLLSRLQTNASLYYPTIQAQQDVLSQAYDLQFEAMPQLFGKELILSYIANFVEPVEILDPEYTYADIVEKIALITQYPSFDPELLTLTQKQLTSNYQELMAEPTNLALDHFFKIWYKDEPEYAENFMGPIEEIKSATPDQLKAFSDNLRLMPTTVVGIAKDNKLLKDLIQQEFKQPGLMKDFKINDLTINAPLRHVDQVDSQHNYQAQLMIGYGYHHPLSYRDQVVGMVLAQYLAGDQSSKLFTEIREKLGAAYAVEANNYANNSLFLISAGLDPEKITQAKQIVSEEISQIIAGQIDAELLKRAKKSLLNMQLIGKDQPSWQLAQLLRNQLFVGYQEFDREVAIKRVSEQQIINFAQNLFFNESYVLK